MDRLRTDMDKGYQQNALNCWIAALLYLAGMDAPPRPAPPRGKTGCPAPPRPAKSRPCPAPPRPAKLTKSAGRSGAKLTADSIDTPFYYARD